MTIDRRRSISLEGDDLALHTPQSCGLDHTIRVPCNERGLKVIRTILERARELSKKEQLYIGSRYSPTQRDVDELYRKVNSTPIEKVPSTAPELRRADRKKLPISALSLDLSLSSTIRRLKIMSVENENESPYVKVIPARAEELLSKERQLKEAERHIRLLEDNVRVLEEQARGINRTGPSRKYLGILASIHEARLVEFFDRYGRLRLQDVTNYFLEFRMHVKEAELLNMPLREYSVSRMKDTAFASSGQNSKAANLAFTEVQIYQPYRNLPND